MNSAAAKSVVLAIMLLAGRGDDVCSESEVEQTEEAEMEAMRQELLQHGVRHLKAGDREPSDALTADAVSNLQQQASEIEEEEEQALALRLDKQVEVLESMTKEVESSKQAVYDLIHHRHQVAAAQAPSSGPVDCEKYPMFCDPKVNCAQQPLTADDKAALQTRLATSDGKANLRTWCMAYPMYATSVQKCIVEGDPKGYAKEMFESQKKLKLVSADAIYCFVAGHCNNTEVTDSTTVQEAEAVCDKLYGHARWSNIGWKDFMEVLARALQLGRDHKIPKEWNVTGWSSLVKLARHEAEISAMTACSMGNYQCDIAYCKANYCDDPGMRAKFGNLSWSYPDN